MLFLFVSGVRMTKLVLCLFLVEFLGAKAQVQGSLRLVGGTSSNGGRLEVYINGHWGTVCDDSWDNDDARVACRQLGYTGVMTTLTSSFPSRSSSQRTWLDDVRCIGRESKLIDCSHNGYGNEDCSHSEDVGIICTTRNGDIRLVGGNSYRGRVEVYYSEQWHTACYSGWGSMESTAVCKQLGYIRVLSTTRVYTLVSSSNEASVSCSSGVSSLHSCRISTYCSNNYQPYVECTNSSQQSNGEARLVGGSSQYEGRVEVYYYGEWRTICYGGWDYDASSVVCKQLGYGLVAGVTSTYTGSSSGSVSLDCNGHETSLAECSISSNSYIYSCYSRTVVRCTNSNVYAPLVWTILIPLVCGLIVLCVLCVPCVVAYCLYREKKPRAPTVYAGNTAEGTVRYATSDEQSRVGYPTLPSTDQEGEVQINYHSGDGGQIGVGTTVGPGLVVMDQPPEDIESPPPSILQDQPLDSLQKQ